MVSYLFGPAAALKATDGQMSAQAWVPADLYPCVACGTKEKTMFILLMLTSMCSARTYSLQVI